MAKSKEKNIALELRKNGESIKDIAKKLKIVKSTISLWCRDIILTPEQIQRLHQKMIKGGYKGRMKGARLQYERRLKKIKELKDKGSSRLGKLSDREFLAAGAALYWGEGSRKRRDVKINNSDPDMIKFMIEWFRRFWDIKKDRITLYVTINKIHKNRVQEVENYWSRVTKISKSQFTKTVLITAKNKKNYKNFPIHYGTLTIRVKRPVEIHHQIIGLIEGLSKNINYSPG